MNRVVTYHTHSLSKQINPSTGLVYSLSERDELIKKQLMPINNIEEIASIIGACWHALKEDIDLELALSELEIELSSSIKVEQFQMPDDIKDLADIAHSFYTEMLVLAAFAADEQSKQLFADDIEAFESNED